MTLLFFALHLRFRNIFFTYTTHACDINIHEELDIELPKLVIDIFNAYAAIDGCLLTPLHVENYANQMIVVFFIKN